MSKENIYKKAKKNFDKKVKFAIKFNKDNNLNYGDEGFVDGYKMSSEIERETKRLTQSISNMVFYTINNDVEGIESKEIEDCGWLIKDYTNRKERAEFMISLLQKEVKRCKELESLTRRSDSFSY